MAAYAYAPRPSASGWLPRPRTDRFRAAGRRTFPAGGAAPPAALSGEGHLPQAVFLPRPPHRPARSAWGGCVLRVGEPSAWGGVGAHRLGRCSVVVAREAPAAHEARLRRYPEVAVPALDALIASERHEVAAVVTRPDAPAGRGRRMVASPVAERAEEAGIEVLKPAKPKDPDFLERLREIAPDCCPVVAYGALLPASPWTSRRTAGSTCTSRCCPPGGGPRRCSTPSWRATRSPGPPPSSSRKGSTPGPSTAPSPRPSAPPTPAVTC